jgi:hypothetical protein
VSVSYTLLADLVGLVHGAIVLFIVAGQVAILVGWALGWGWTRRPVFRFAHLGAITFVVVQTWLGQLCPLTAWENDLRRLAKQEGVGESFIAYWLNRLLYYQVPHEIFVAAYTAFGALVLATFLLYPPRRRP